MDVIRSIPLDEVLLEIYGSINQPGNWETALDTAVKATGAVSGLVAVRHRMELDAASRGDIPYELQTTSALLREQQEQVAEYFCKCGHYEAEEIDQLEKFPILDVVNEERLYGKNSIPIDRADFRFREEAFGMRSRLATRLGDSRRWTEHLLMQFSEECSSIPAKKLDAFRRLAPHFAIAVELSRIFHILKQRYSAAFGALDEVAIDLCIADKDGNIVLRNASASAILENNPMIHLCPEGRLRFSDSAIGERVRSAIESMVDTADGLKEVCESFCISAGGSGIAEDARRKGNPRNEILVEVAPIRDSLAEIGPCTGYALVSLVDLSVDRPVTVDRLSLLYQLSPAESDVCRLLITGCTFSQIAEMRYVAVETIKSQSRSISMKTATQSRIDLVHLALKTSPPIGLNERS